MNKYFIAYNWCTVSESGIGNTIIFHDKSIERCDDIIKIREYIESGVIKQKNCNVNISIINIIKLPI